MLRFCATLLPDGQVCMSMIVSYLMTVVIVIVVFVASFIAITSWVQVLQFIRVHKVENFSRRLLDQAV